MADEATSPVYRLEGGVAVITLDDGKANAISNDLLARLHEALDRAESEAQAVVIVGRPGRFSAGFDLKAMTASLDSMRELVTGGARFLMRLYGLDLPTVAACTGHALAAGALTLLSCDTRIGAEGDFKIGLNEVAIGMPLPVFAVELARDRLAHHAFGASTIQARIHTPAEAAEAGFLDRVVDAGRVEAEAIAEAQRLGEIRRGAYARTKRAARSRSITYILDTLDADMADVDGPDA
jgi:enoyl-CoA hydratase